MRESGTRKKRETTGKNDPYEEERKKERSNRFKKEFDVAANIRKGKADWYKKKDNVSNTIRIKSAIKGKRKRKFI